MHAKLEAEYGDFVAARAGTLVRYAYLLCGDWHRAEDTVQSGLTKLYLAWPRLAGTGAVDAYVRRIITRTLIDEGRLVRFRRERLSDRLPETPARDDASVAVDDRLSIMRALSQVPPRQRAVVVLRYWEDQSLEQVAELLGCSVGNVKSQAARGLAVLRELLGDHLVQPAGRN
jgi:RNA polymerase sigma-70 factor (sigma-E family)